MTKRIISFLTTVILVLSLAFSCDDPKNNITPDDFDVQLSIPALIEADSQDRTATLSVIDSKAPQANDKLLFTNDKGVIIACPFVDINSASVTVKLANGIVDGKYSVSIRREQRKKALGTTEVKFFKKITFEPAASSTVYGVVKCGDKALAGIVVSDGNIVCTTNEEGIYEMPSKLENGYVFISVPSGYEVSRKGVLPEHFVNLSKEATSIQRADFELSEAKSQDNFKLLVFGDMHLAKRTGDISQFRRFTDDVNKTVSSSTVPTYGVTLGDMTWDLYWYDNKFSFNEYMNEISAIKNLTIYQTIGNHDHDMNQAGDFMTVNSYRSALGPNYYSYNVGNYHVVVLDNIECTNDGSGNRTYNCLLVNEELEWLEEDLKHVPASTPLILTMHSNFFNESGSAKTQNSAQLLKLVGGRQTHIFSGHTHVVFNVDKVKDSKIFEHNAGAVCACWWWSGYLSPGINISTDGSPAGYTIVDVSGNDMKWQYKATDAEVSHQFRSYDRNSINLSSSTYCPDATGDYLKKYQNVTASYSSDNSNLIYVNVWNWDPEWKVEMFENGEKLTVSKISDYDPLHAITYTAKRANKNSTITFPTTKTSHMFKAQASSAKSTIQIKVTDRFGNVYTEDMARPKAFNESTYKLY